MFPTIRNCNLPNLLQNNLQRKPNSNKRRRLSHFLKHHPLRRVIPVKILRKCLLKPRNHLPALHYCRALLLNPRNVSFHIWKNMGQCSRTLINSCVEMARIKMVVWEGPNKIGGYKLKHLFRFNWNQSTRRNWGWGRSCIFWSSRASSRWSRWEKSRLSRNGRISGLEERREQLCSHHSKTLRGSIAPYHDPII